MDCFHENASWSLLLSWSTATTRSLTIFGTLRKETCSKLPCNINQAAFNSYLGTKYDTCTCFGWVVPCVAVYVHWSFLTKLHKSVSVCVPVAAARWNHFWRCYTIYEVPTRPWLLCGTFFVGSPTVYDVSFLHLFSQDTIFKKIVAYRISTFRVSKVDSFQTVLLFAWRHDWRHFQWFFFYLIHALFGESVVCYHKQFPWSLTTNCK